MTPSRMFIDWLVSPFTGFAGGRLYGCESALELLRTGSRKRPDGHEQQYTAREMLIILLQVRDKLQEAIDYYADCLEEEHSKDAHQYQLRAVDRAALLMKARAK